MAFTPRSPGGFWQDRIEELGGGLPRLIREGARALEHAVVGEFTEGDAEEQPSPSTGKEFPAITPAPGAGLEVPGFWAEPRNPI